MLRGQAGGTRAAGGGEAGAAGRRGGGAARSLRRKGLGGPRAAGRGGCRLLHVGLVARRGIFPGAGESGRDGRARERRLADGQEREQSGDRGPRPWPGKGPRQRYFAPRLHHHPASRARPETRGVLYGPGGAKQPARRPRSGSGAGQDHHQASTGGEPGGARGSAGAQAGMARRSRCRYSSPPAPGHRPFRLWRSSASPSPGTPTDRVRPAASDARDRASRTAHSPTP